MSGRRHDGTAAARRDCSIERKAAEPWQIVGGFLFVQFGAVGVTGFNLYSMLVAIVGAVVVLLIYHAVFGRRRIGP